MIKSKYVKVEMPQEELFTLIKKYINENKETSSDKVLLEDIKYSWDDMCISGTLKDANSKTKLANFSIDLYGSEKSTDVQVSVSNISMMAKLALAALGINLKTSMDDCLDKLSKKIV